MIAMENRLATEPEIDRGRWLHRWVCSVCLRHGVWLLNPVTARKNGELHATTHGQSAEL